MSASDRTKRRIDFAVGCLAAGGALIGLGVTPWLFLEGQYAWGALGVVGTVFDVFMAWTLMSAPWKAPL